MAQIEQIKSQKPAKSNKFMFSFNKLSYIFTGVILILAIIIISVYFINQQDDEFTISSLPDEAFGSLKSEIDAAVEDQVSSEALGIGGGGGMIGIMPEAVRYSYQYKGEEFTQEDDRVDVLKRVKSKASSGIANLIKGMNFGIIDLGKLSDAQLETASFFQDKKWGYAAYINFLDGSISINNTWDGWKEIFNQQEPIKESDIPSEERIIEVANNFIKEFGVKMDNYGQPEVKLNQMMIQYERSGSLYIPESIQVVYPLMIQNRLVYDEWGNEAGLTVSVNFRAMKVTNMYGLTTQDYQSSSYPAETDVDKILAIAKEGGINQYYYGNIAKTINLEITTPSLIYMKTWKNNDKGQSDELLIPALLFPVAEVSEKEGYYRENIVVPLAKGLLERDVRPLME